MKWKYVFSNLRIFTENLLVPLQPRRQGNCVNSSNVFVTCDGRKKKCFTEEMKPSTSTACKLTVLCRDTHLVLNKLAKHFRNTIFGVVFCVSNVLRNYLHICRFLHWAVLNEGEVVIPWGLQSVNSSLDSVFSLCEK